MVRLKSLRSFAKKAKVRAKTVLAKVKPRAQPSTLPPSTFHVNHMAKELLHMIFTLLRPKEAANFRLVCRNTAEVGLEYIVPEFHLIHTIESFLELLAIAAHPVVSRHVRALHYQADAPIPSGEPKPWAGNWTLDKSDNSIGRTWPIAIWYRRQIRGEDTRRDLELPSIASFGRRFRMLGSNLEDVLDVICERIDDRDTEIYKESLARALKSFPKLKKITMSMHRSPDPELRQLLSMGLATSNGDISQVSILGIPETLALLLGAHTAGLKLDTLTCGAISWRFLMQDEHTLANMKQSVRAVQTMDLTIVSNYSHPQNSHFQGWIESQQCSVLLRNGILSDFISSAPCLKTLNFSSGLYSHFVRESERIDLRDIVGSVHWPFLQTVTFSRISMDEEDIVGFCSKHANTLKTLMLADILLTKGGWMSTFTRLRQVLMLEYCAMEGIFQGGRIAGPWIMNFDERRHCPPFGKAISEYLMSYDISDLPLLAFIQRAMQFFYVL